MKNTELVDEKGNTYKPVKNDMSVLSTLTARTRNVDLAGRIVYNDNNVEVFNFGNTKINQ
jgi:DNA polymerase-3 subunit epsilon